MSADTLQTPIALLGLDVTYVLFDSLVGTPSLPIALLGFALFGVSSLYFLWLLVFSEITAVDAEPW